MEQSAQLIRQKIKRSKKYYSRKKKRNTPKNILVVNGKMEFLFISPSIGRKVLNHRILKESKLLKSIPKMWKRFLI